MKSHFPIMLDRPGTRRIASGITYFLISFYAFPLVGMMFAQDASQELYGAWIDIFYHLCNFVITILIFRRYLADSFLNVQVYTKVFWSTVGICTAAVVVLKVVIFGAAYLSQNTLFLNTAFGTLLTSELDLEFFSTALVLEQPIWGTLVLVLVCPFTISCLLYGCIFAPICNNRPRLAYVVMTGILLLIHAVSIFCHWSSDEQIMMFLISLPVHLIACLSYHIADTVWAPIAVHTFSNLILTILLFAFF